MKLILKTSLFVVAVLCTLSLSANENAKKKVTTLEFTVSGVCQMCETRIEEAALIKGVKLAQWDKKKQKIKVIYRPDKTDELSIHKAIAKAGHDTPKVKATDEAYQKLHDCCKYRDGQQIH